MEFARCIAWGLAVFAASGASAQVHKCTDAQGRTEYKAVPCSEGRGQPLPLPATAGAANPGAGAAPRSPASEALASACLDLHAKVEAASARLAGRDKLVRTLAAGGPSAMNEAEAREFNLLSQHDRLAIQEWQRQGSVAGCGGIQLMPGTPQAAAAGRARHCQRLRDSAQEWDARHGANSPDRARTLAILEQQAREEGCGR